MAGEALFGGPEPWPAPGKLNLFLHVVGRRADGYHLLQSVFVLVDWCDLLHFERRTDGRLAPPAVIVHVRLDPDTRP